MATSPRLPGRFGAKSSAAGFVTAAVLLGGGVAYAAIPATSTGRFTACVNKTSGATRVIDYEAGKRCASTETTVSWSKGWVYRAAWVSTTIYNPGDVVYASGGSYLAKVTSANRPPAANPTYWAPVAVRGATGAIGPKGATGATGARGPAGPSYAKSASRGGVFPTVCANTDLITMTLTPSVRTGVMAVAALGFNPNGGPSFNPAPSVTVYESGTPVGVYSAPNVYLGGSEQGVLPVNGLVVDSAGNAAVLEAGHTYQVTLRVYMYGNCSGSPYITSATLTAQYVGLTA